MAIIAAFVYVKEVAIFILHPKYGSIVLGVALGIQVVVMLILSCCEGLRRLYPFNIILLFTYTVIQGLFLGIMALNLSKDEVSYYNIL